MGVGGSLALVGSVLLGLALWLVVKDTAATKIGVEFAFVVLAAFLVVATSIAAGSAVAKVQDDRLEFFFCGMRMRSFALDGTTSFDLKKIGRLEVLCIQRGPETYVPNEALDKDALIGLLRASGVAERKAD
jgi:hypothetical protein